MKDCKIVSFISSIFLLFQLIRYCFTVNPEKDPQARGDPFRTLFVARLSYDVKEADLEREFGRFGPIERVWRSYPSCHLQALTYESQISLVKDTVSDKKKKPHQGYAFIVYEREKDMKGINTMPIHLAMKHFLFSILR